MSVPANALRLSQLMTPRFSQFEGYDNEKKRNDNMNRARAWFKVLEVRAPRSPRRCGQDLITQQALDCQMLQVGSSDDPSSSSDYGVIARDLRALADEAAERVPPIKMCVVRLRASSATRPLPVVGGLT